MSSLEIIYHVFGTLEKYTMLYVIESESEKGFWSNEDGWVYDIASATTFTTSDATMSNLPMSRGNDAKWRVYSYDDN